MWIKRDISRAMTFLHKWDILSSDEILEIEDDNSLKWEDIFGNKIMKIEDIHQKWWREGGRFWKNTAKF